MAASLPYEEPGIVDVVVLSTFLLALNVFNSGLNRTLYCGLVGQVLVGVAYGTPGAKWLSESLEHSIVQLGYLGLIMIVFEGGLSSSLATMKANLLLSSCVALTGVATPMALSFLLAPMAGASPLQCFAAGAALCSTSLGTTFTVLSTSGLVSTRLGSVLSTAAMMDDVAGLVMVQIVSSLGSGSSANISASTVIRPILVSIAFALVVPLACRFVLGPAWAVLQQARARYAGSRVDHASQSKEAVFFVQTALLLALVTAASYAGASALLAAYLAGIVGAYWQATALQSTKFTSEDDNVASPIQGAVSDGSARRAHENIAMDLARTSPSDMYEHYYVQSIERVLKPFFFASIGFSIPIRKMFTGAVVWRGIVYTVLMLLGKAVCGIWLIRFSPPLTETIASIFSAIASLMRRLPLGSFIKHQSKAAEPVTRGHGAEDDGSPNESTTSAAPSRQQAAEAPTSSIAPPTSNTSHKTKTPSKPLSLYPAGIMSFAMVARGEIGFLISSVAESKGIFSSPSLTGSVPTDGASEIFLIITWAIVLCTMIGPLCVGLLVRRVKKLEAARMAAPAGGQQKDVLGVWGVS